MLDDSILFMLKVLCSDENSSQYTSYLIKKMIEINLEWKGQDDMLANDIRIASVTEACMTADDIWNTVQKIRCDKAKKFLVVCNSIDIATKILTS